MNFLCYVLLFFTCLSSAMDSRVLPADVKTILDEHSEELKGLLHEWNARPDARMGFNVAWRPWLQGYCIKYGIERVENAQKLKNVIEKRKLDLLAVPDKYLYPVCDSMEIVSNDTHVVIAKVVKGKSGKGIGLSLDQLKQLYQLAILGGHYDLHIGNMVNTQEGKVFIIDTDKLSMPTLEEIKELKHDWLLHGNRLCHTVSSFVEPETINDPLVKLEMGLYSRHRNYSDEAYKYFRAKLDKREKLRVKLVVKLTTDLD